MFNRLRKNNTRCYQIRLGSIPKDILEGNCEFHGVIGLHSNSWVEMSEIALNQYRKETPLDQPKHQHRPEKDAWQKPMIAIVIQTHL